MRFRVSATYQDGTYGTYCYDADIDVQLSTMGDYHVFVPEGLLTRIQVVAMGQSRSWGRAFDPPQSAIAGSLIHRFGNVVVRCLSRSQTSPDPSSPQEVEYAVKGLLKLLEETS